MAELGPDLSTMLRQFRLAPEIAASRMSWAPEWPLDRLMFEAASQIDRFCPLPQGAAREYMLETALKNLSHEDRGVRDLALYVSSTLQEPSEGEIVTVQQRSLAEKAEG